MGFVIHILVSRLSTTYPLTPTYPPPSPASPSSSMTLTVLLFFLLILFIVFFSIFARRLFVGAHFPSASARRPPPPPPSLRSRLCYLGSAAGLDPTMVRALPVLTYAEWMRRSRTSKEAAGGECVVCLGELEDEWVKVIPGCGHVFHPCCIDGWLVLHGSCPICRCSQLLTGAGAGAGEVRVDLGGGPREGEMVGLGRSRSLGCWREEGSGGEGGAGLRRSWSCSG